jgi:hypothetical protein
MLTGVLSYKAWLNNIIKRSCTTYDAEVKVSTSFSTKRIRHYMLKKLFWLSVFIQGKCSIGFIGTSTPIYPTISYLLIL